MMNDELRKLHFNDSKTDNLLIINRLPPNPQGGTLWKN